MSEGWAFHQGIPVKQEDFELVPVRGMTNEELRELYRKQSAHLEPEPCG